MHIQIALRILGSLLMMFSLTMVPPVLVSFLFADGVHMVFLRAFAVTFIVGFVLWLVFKRDKAEMRIKDGFLVTVFFYIALGTVIEGLAMIFLTVPIFVPIVDGLGYDLIWFGIVMVMVVEISLITPPIGLNVFILKSMLPDVPLPTIFKGIIPFFTADIIRLLLVVFFPGIALFLPSILS